MSVISGTDYLAIATAYSNARKTMLSATTYFYNAVYTIVGLNSIVPTIQLLGDFYTSYVVNTSRLQNMITLESAVRALQQHIVSQSEEKDINLFLHDNVGGGVPSDWATLSASVGYTIDDIHINHSL